jgi:hypothetical protein
MSYVGSSRVSTIVAIHNLIGDSANDGPYEATKNAAVIND